MQQNHSYSKIKCLFKGYAGKVYLIESRSENDPPNKKPTVLVLKRYYRKASDPQDHTSLTEYKFLNSLHHPNIVSMVGAFTEPFEYKKYLCITMQHMAPLHELLPQLKDCQLYVFKEVCRAIHYLHTKKILHRDIKPSNIFATEEGKIKLGDFGISTEFKPSMTPQTCTKNYRAPELFFGQKSYDYSIDIWSLGCTLVEFYTGKILFDGRSEIEIMTQIADLLGSLNEANWNGVSQLPMYLEFINESKPKLSKLLDKLPRQVSPLIEVMLRMNPLERPTIAQILEYLEKIEIPDQSIQVSLLAQNLLSVHMGHKNKYSLGN